MSEEKPVSLQEVITKDFEAQKQAVKEASKGLFELGSIPKGLVRGRVTKYLQLGKEGLEEQKKEIKEGSKECFELERIPKGLVHDRVTKYLQLSKEDLAKQKQTEKGSREQVSISKPDDYKQGSEQALIKQGSASQFSQQKIKYPKALDSFGNQEEFHTDDTASHRMLLANKKKSAEDSKVRKEKKDAQKKFSGWFLKEEKDYTEALCEVLAGEFFRLIIPTQPKTRLVLQKNFDEIVYWIASKAVPDFSPLTSFKPRNGIYSSGPYLDQIDAGFLERGCLINAGLISAVSFYLNELDLKDKGNLGVNGAGALIKLDHGLCFGRLKKRYSQDQLFHDFSERDIACLPYLVRYKPFNWFDLKRI